VPRRGRDAAGRHPAAAQLGLSPERGVQDALRADAVEVVRSQGVVGFFRFPERYGPAPFPMFAAYRKSVRIQLASGTQGWTPAARLRCA
jgi:hypothetical protein